MILSRIRELLRSLLGDNFAARLHGKRLAGLAKRAIDADPEMLYAQTLLKDGDVAIDVGANGANWTLALSKPVGGNGHVYAFEPHPYYFKATVHAIRNLNLGNVTLLDTALGERSSTAQLLTNDNGQPLLSGRARIVESGQYSSDSAASVNMRTLDDVAADFGFLDRVRLLKSDTEGYEYSVLKGAARLLARSRPVLFIEVGHEVDHGYSSNELQEFLFEHGYRAYAFDKAENTLIELVGLEVGSNRFGANRFLFPSE